MIQHSCCLAEGDDLLVCHPRITTQEQTDLLGYFYLLLGFGGEMNLGRVDACGSVGGKEPVLEFCSTTQALIRGVWHTLPVLPRVAIRAGATPRTRDIAAAKGLSLAHLAPTSPTVLAFAKRLTRWSKAPRITRAHLESLDRPDLPYESLLSLKDKMQGMEPCWDLLETEAHMVARPINSKVLYNNSKQQLPPNYSTK